MVSTHHYYHAFCWSCYRIWCFPVEIFQKRARFCSLKFQLTSSRLASRGFRAQKQTRTCFWARNPRDANRELVSWNSFLACWLIEWAVAARLIEWAVAAINAPCHVQASWSTSRRYRIACFQRCRCYRWFIAEWFGPLLCMQVWWSDQMLQAPSTVDSNQRYCSRIYGEDRRWGGYRRSDPWRIGTCTQYSWSLLEFSAVQKGRNRTFHNNIGGGCYRYIRTCTCVHSTGKSVTESIAGALAE